MKLSKLTPRQSLRLMKENKAFALGWVLAVVFCVALIFQSVQYKRVCTHIMNINDGLYVSNASVETKNRAAYLASYCFVR